MCDHVTSKLQAHYAHTFAAHGETPRGVDWRDENTASIRMAQMLGVVNPKNTPCSILDAGCGYGALMQIILDEKLPYDYTGVDVVPEMIAAARKRHPNASFLCQDIFSLPKNALYDYAVCNGILTQKLDISIEEMDAFAKRLIAHLFSLCRRGTAFNVMSNHVNFTASNLYYKNPAEMLDYCLSSITRNVRLNHHYGMYEYTVYLYH